jgi:ATP-dependent DNA helicase DinG
VIFSNILTKYGYVLREKQAELSEQMLSALKNNKILISEAAVGIGKTHAYLIATVLHKQSAKNGFWLRCAYPKSNNSLSDTSMPIVVSTSSIALQQALTQDYIPEISGILLENKLIRNPLTSVVRKGKEHYICDVRMQDYIPHANEDEKQTLKELNNIDLDNANSL